MLSEENYKALLRFRNGLVKYDKKLTEREELLLHYGLIRIVKRKEATNGDGYTMTYIQEYWKITALGEDALQEFENSPLMEQLEELKKLRQDFDQYRSEYAAYKSAEEHRTKIAERKGAIRGFISALLVTIIGGLVVYYWSATISFLANLFAH